MHQDQAKSEKMKRAGKLWDKFLEPGNALAAIMAGTQKKRGDRIVRQFLYSDEEVREDPSLYHQIDPKRAEPYIRELIEDLRMGRWQHRTPYCNEIVSKSQNKAGGKRRTVYVPCLRDHIVQHMVIQVCAEVFNRGMHPHCCGSVPGRGQYHVVKTAGRWFKRDRQCRYFVKLDIRHFFDSIRPELLMDVIKRKVKDQFILEIFYQIIHAAPTACPIGFYVSPILANLFLQDFDHFVEQELYKVRRGKRIKYVRHYMRYMDDMLLIGTSKADLYKAVREIRKYLRTIGLEIKPEWEIKRIGIDWCDYIGYRFSRDAVVLRRGIFLSAARLARKMGRAGYYTLKQCMSLNARIGWARHCDSRCFAERFIKPFVNIFITRRIIACGSKV